MAISIPIVNGGVSTETTPTNASQEKKTTGTDSLGKEAFLQLLVAQLQYQDPLEPASNQEFLGELAQFSSLEEMQNLTSTLTSNNALTLTGRNVILEVGTDATQVGGYVEYVQITNGKAELSINGILYDAADLKMVLDDTYLAAIVGGGTEENPDSTEGDASEAEE